MYEETSSAVLREQLPNTEEIAHPQAVWLIHQVYGEDPRFEGITHDIAQGLVQMLNTIDLRHERAAMAAEEINPNIDFEESRNLASMYINGRNLDDMEKATGINADRAQSLIKSLIARLQDVSEAEMRQYLDKFFADPAPWRLGMAGFDDPKACIDVWPYAVRKAPAATQLIERGISLRQLGFAKIQGIPEIWSSQRSGQRIPQYVKVMSNNTLAHPDFPAGLVLDESQRGLLNIFLQTRPGDRLTLRDLTEIWPRKRYGQGDLLIDALQTLNRHHLIFRAKNLDCETGSIFLLNPTIVFMEERPDYAPKLTYSSEFLKLIAQIRRQVMYQGVAFIEDDTALGLGEAFTDEMEVIFDSGIVKRHEHDHPPTRERADGKVHARQLVEGDALPASLNGMPGWEFILEGGNILFEEAISNDLPPTETISKRPENLSRLWAYEHPLLRRALAIMNLIAYPPEVGNTSVITQEFHAFRTHDVVTETKHNDGGKALVGLRVTRRDCEGGYTEFFRRSPELNPTASFQDTPFLSLEIPVGGWGFFDDRRVQHIATRITTPTSSV